MISNAHSSPEDGDSRSSSAIAAEAADWLVRRDDGFSAAEQREFDEWIETDERHREVFAEMAETWQLLDEWPDQVSAEASAPRAQTHAPRLPRARKLIWLQVALGAAAVLALVFAGPWWRSARSVEMIEAKAEGARTMELPDGSVVFLDAGSRVELHFSAAERRVRLVQGEAHFQVMKNPARPFVVSAGQVAVRAVGTAFSVKMNPQTVEVLVTEGRVAVNDSAKGASLLANSPVAGEVPVLVAGQRAVIAIDATTGPRAPAEVAGFSSDEVAKVAAWTARPLEFVAAPLSEIVAEFNRYNRHKLVVGDARLAAQRFGGTFPADDYDALVRLLETNFGVRAEQREDQTILRLAP